VFRQLNIDAAFGQQRAALMQHSNKRRVVFELAPPMPPGPIEKTTEETDFTDHSRIKKSRSK